MKLYEMDTRRKTLAHPLSPEVLSDWVRTVRTPSLVLPGNVCVVAVSLASLIFFGLGFAAGYTYLATKLVTALSPLLHHK